MVTMTVAIGAGEPLGCVGSAEDRCWNVCFTKRCHALFKSVEVGVHGEKLSVPCTNTMSVPLVNARGTGQMGGKARMALGVGTGIIISAPRTTRPKATRTVKKTAERIVWFAKATRLKINRQMSFFLHASEFRKATGNRRLRNPSNDSDKVMHSPLQRGEVGPLLRYRREEGAIAFCK